VTEETTKAEEPQQPYLSMKKHYYYSATVVLYLTETLGGAYIKSVAVVFGFVAAVSVSMISFIFPGAFYLMSSQKYLSTVEQAQ